MNGPIARQARGAPINPLDWANELAGYEAHTLLASEMTPTDGQLPGGGFGPPVVMPLPGGGVLPIPGLPTGIGGGIGTRTFGIGGWTLSNATDPVSGQPGDVGTGGDASPPVEGDPGMPAEPTPWPEPVLAPPDSTPAPTPPAPVDGNKSPEAVQHIKDAQDAGHPDVLIIDRPGTTARRQASLRGINTSPGNDRDEYPPAVTQQGGAGASVRPIPSGDNRSAGGQLGGQIRQLPDGTWIRVRVILADPTPNPADPSSPSLVP